MKKIKCSFSVLVVVLSNDCDVIECLPFSNKNQTAISYKNKSCLLNCKMQCEPEPDTAAIVSPLKHEHWTLNIVVDLWHNAAHYLRLQFITSLSLFFACCPFGIVPRASCVPTLAARTHIHIALFANSNIQSDCKVIIQELNFGFCNHFASFGMADAELQLIIFDNVN